MAPRSTSVKTGPTPTDPGLHNYMQLASIGYGNTPMEDHMGVDPHPFFNKGQDVDPILNLLAHAAHPTELSPSGKEIGDKIDQLAGVGANIVRKYGRNLDDDHTIVVDQNGQPQMLDLGGQK